MRRRGFIILLAAAVLIGPGVAWGLMLSGSEADADGVVTASFTGVGGTPISALADFTVVDADTLTILLRNTAPSTDVNGNALTGLFWDLPGLTLSPVSAVATSPLVNPTACSNPVACSSTTNVGGEFPPSFL